MSDTTNASVETKGPSKSVFPNKTLYFLALIFVFVGIINSTPQIPGWEELWRSLTGNKDFKVNNFATEWFYPIVFFVMMMIVAMKHSMWRSWQGTSRAAFGLFMDIALVACAAAISVTYLIEIDSVCIIDMMSLKPSMIRNV